MAEQDDSWQPLWYRLARSAVLLVAGLSLLFWEVLDVDQPRMRMIVIYLYMMGLSITTNREEKKQ